MAEELKEVLRDLHKVLARLETVISTQDPPAEEDTKTHHVNENRAEVDSTISYTGFQTLEEWVQDREVDEARLREMRDAFINRLTGYAPRSSTNGAPWNTDIFSFDDGLTLQLKTQRSTIRNLRFWDRIRLKEEIEKCWPTQPTKLYTSLYKSDSSGYPLMLSDKSHSSGNKVASGRMIFKRLTGPKRLNVLEFTEFAAICIWLPRDTHIIMDLINSFAGTKRVSYTYPLHIYSEGYKFLVGYYLRYCQSSDWGNYEASGIVLDREHAAIRTQAGDTHLYEKRVCLSLTMERLSDAVAYTLLVVCDDHLVYKPKLYKETWRKYGIEPCGNAIGVAQFQAMVCIFSDVWVERWEEILDEVDQVIRVKFDDTLDEKRWDQFMFDDSFRLSKTYFTVLQILRIMPEWIKGSVSDQKHLQEQWLRYKMNLKFLTLDEVASIERNWSTIISGMELRAKRLLDRISWKTEEVKSLRDGLFNATSLREASKGMALNRAIYAFTIVTVIFTPLGFMATFWALPIFNNPPSDGNGPSSAVLTATFVIVPLLTYILSLFAVGYFNLESSQRSFNSDRSQKAIETFFGTLAVVSKMISAAVRRVREMAMDILRSLYRVFRQIFHS